MSATDTLAQPVVARLDHAVGGPARRRVVVLLALDAADNATLGAVAAELEASIGITNLELGVLASPRSRSRV
jgi:hypothetical protein